ncbi:hypothetical protein C0J52_09163 [Blattella germanica]|nr:hypothetical protein C0J52_09163 [Blattella germanica]
MKNQNNENIAPNVNSPGPSNITEDQQDSKLNAQDEVRRLMTMKRDWRECHFMARLELRERLNVMSPIIEKEYEENELYVDMANLEDTTEENIYEIIQDLDETLEDEKMEVDENYDFDKVQIDNGWQDVIDWTTGEKYAEEAEEHHRDPVYKSKAKYPVQIMLIGCGLTHIGSLTALDIFKNLKGFRSFIVSNIGGCLVQYHA